MIIGTDFQVRDKHYEDNDIHLLLLFGPQGLNLSLRSRHKVLGILDSLGGFLSSFPSQFL